MAEFVVTNSIGVSKKYLAKRSHHILVRDKALIGYDREGRIIRYSPTGWMYIERANDPSKHKAAKIPMMCLTRSAACREQSDT